MKIFKIIDCWIQLLLIIGCTVYAFYDHDFVLYAYFVVGGCQVLSCLIHLAFPNHFFSTTDRNYYNKTLLITLILGVVTIPVCLIFGFGLLFASPLLAIWYTSICFKETKILKHKAFVHIK